MSLIYDTVFSFDLSEHLSELKSCEKWDGTVIRNKELVTKSSIQAKRDSLVMGKKFVIFYMATSINVQRSIQELTA